MKYYSRLLVLSLMLIFALSANASNKTIGIVVFDGVLTSDVTAPLEVFGIASKQAWFKDYTVKTVGVTEQSSITTEEGLRIGVDSRITQKEAFDVLIIPSSYSMKPLLKNKALITFIQQQARTAKWIASNCSGAELLAKANVLDGKKATTWAGGEAALQRRYPNVNVQTDKNIVVDGNILTSNGSLVSYQAALRLLRLMTSQETAQKVAEALQYSRLSTRAF